MPHIICLGDPTSHGGKVESITAPWFTVDGIPVARVGDQCSCPKPGHHHCTIANGNPAHLIDGIEVAYAGNTTTCGAELQSTADSFGKV